MKRRHLQKTLLAGVLVTVPVIITLAVLRILFNLVDGILAPWIWLAVRAFWPEAPAVPGVGIVATLVVIYLAGLLATNMIGKTILHRVESLFQRLPVVKGIYSAVKQLTDAVAKGDANSFQKVVFIEFPAKGSWTLGFVTGELRDAQGDVHVTVFVPTTPNPTTGFVYAVREDKVMHTSMTIEDGFKFLMSAGVVQPASLATHGLPVPGVEHPTPERKIGSGSGA